MLEQISKTLDQIYSFFQHQFVVGMSVLLEWPKVTPVSLLISEGVYDSAWAPNKQEQEEQEALGEEHCVRDSEKWAEVLSICVCMCALVFFSLVFVVACTDGWMLPSDLPFHNELLCFCMLAISAYEILWIWIYKKIFKCHSLFR